MTAQPNNELSQPQSRRQRQPPSLLRPVYPELLLTSPRRQHQRDRWRLPARWRRLPHYRIAKREATDLVMVLWRARHPTALKWSSPFEGIAKVTKTVLTERYGEWPVRKSK